MPHDSPLPGGHTLVSDEGRMQQKELIDLVTKLSDRVLVLEIDLKETKKVYSNAFTKLIMKVKKLEKIVKSNKARRRAKFIVSDDEEDLEDYSKHGRRIADIDQDSDISLVHHDGDIQGRYKDISTTEFNISTAKPVSTDGAAVTTASVSTTEPSAPSTTTIKTYTRTTRGVTIREPNTRQRLSPQQQIDPKNKGKGKMVESEKPSKKKDQVKADEELAKRLKEEMQAELEEEARIKIIAQEEASIAISNKPPTRAQLRNKIVTYLKYMGKYTHNQLKIKSLEEIQKLYEREQIWIKDFVPMDSEVVGSSAEKGVGSRKNTC
ncbi:hypothetical protein Tco_1045432 [Tanacetum coccineum]|uniref:Uncharacterized protein n=1 Tax=Tanacetum coccineum TaxID=301880 RepID=A0ABQ5GST9_9ASTR